MKHIILFVCVLLVTACTPEKEQILDLTYTVDKVVCQANSNYFVTDGVSQLGLEVKLYTKAGTYTDINGKQQPKYQEIPKERWRHHDIKFFDKSGKEYPANFTATSLEVPYIDFYAEVDGVRSSKPILQLLAENPEVGEPIAAEPDPTFFRMNVRQAMPVPEKKQIPIVFHIIDTEDSRDRLQELNSDAVYYVIDLYNKVFGRKTSYASNGANPNLEFVPALRNPNGGILTEPGINRIYLTADQQNKEFGTGFVLANANMYWDYDRYLNVWIVTNSGWNGTSEDQLYTRAVPFVFKSGEYNTEAFPLPPSVDLKELNSEEAVADWKNKPNNLENVGLVFHKNKDEFAKFYPNYVTQLAVFMGVIPNSSVDYTFRYYGNPKHWVDDYCEDTPQYAPYYDDPARGGMESTDFGSSRVKYTAKVREVGASDPAGPSSPWIIYNSCNAGEQSTFSSVITQDQSKRIEWALQHAEARQMWRDSYAIDPVE